MITAEEFFAQYEKHHKTMQIICRSAEEDQKIRRLLHATGRTWHAGQSYEEQSYWVHRRRRNPDSPIFFANAGLWGESPFVSTNDKTCSFTIDDLVGGGSTRLFSFVFEQRREILV